MNINKDKIALLIVDMQNGGCKPNGSLIEMIGVKEDRAGSTYEPINKLREYAYANDIPVIYVVTELKADFSNAGLLAKKFPIQQFNHFFENTWDSKIVEELTPNENDIIVSKTKWSAFYKTDLEKILTENNIEQLIVCGGATDVCVQETTTDAFFRDIECFVPRETTYSFFKENEEIGFAQMSFGRAVICELDDIIK